MLTVPQRWLTFAFALLSAVSGFSAEPDTVALFQPAEERFSQTGKFVALPYENPALYGFRYATSLTEASLGAVLRHDSHALRAETGTGWNAFRADAQTYYLLSPKTHVWGSAAYERGSRRNVRWNETADYERLFPYFVADTIGGHLTAEHYSFEGGFAHRLGRWTLGGEMGYRAVLEYRTRDPRPRNTVAELYGQMGVALRLARFRVAADVRAAKYKQNSSIAFMNELGVTKSYHTTGFGASYLRFDGANNTVNYDGGSYGAGLALVPLDRFGWSAAVRWGMETYDKELPNNNDLRLTNVREHRWQAELARTFSLRKGAWGVKATADLRRRTGKEFIYGTSADNTFPLLSTAGQYRFQVSDFALSAFYEATPSSAWRWSATPVVGFVRTEETYAEPVKRANFSHLYFGADFAVSRAFGARWQLDGGLSATHYASTDHDWQLASATLPYSYRIAADNFAMNSGSRTDGGIRLRLSKECFKGIRLYLQADAHYVVLPQQSHRTTLNASLGCWF